MVNKEELIKSLELACGLADLVSDKMDRRSLQIVDNFVAELSSGKIKIVESSEKDFDNFEDPFDFEDEDNDDPDININPFA